MTKREDHNTKQQTTSICYFYREDHDTKPATSVSFSYRQDSEDKQLSHFAIDHSLRPDGVKQATAVCHCFRSEVKQHSSIACDTLKTFPRIYTEIDTSCRRKNTGMETKTKSP